MRIRYYDWLESLAIFLVLSFHQVWLKGNVPASISMAFVPMAVPLFFMVHGALLFTKEASPSKQVKRFLRVLIQLYVWNTIYLVVSMLTGLTDISEITPNFLFRYYFCKADSSGVTSGHLWFIYALLVLYCLYPVLDACKKHNEKVLKYVMLACFVLSFVRDEVLVYSSFLCERLFGHPLVTEWLLSRVGPYFNSVFWFIAGYYLSQWLKAHPNLKDQKETYTSLAIFGIALGVAILLLERYVIFGSINYNWKPLPNQYEKIGTLIMAFSTFLLFSIIDFKDGKLYSLIKSISIHSQDIFYIHVIFAKLFYVHFYTHKIAGVWMNYARALAVLVLSYLVGQILRRIPFVKKLM